MVQSRLDEAVSGPGLAVEDLAAMLEPRLGEVTIASEVVLSSDAGAFDATWTTLGITADSPDPDFFSLPIDLRAVGVEPAGSIVLAPGGAEESLTVERLTVLLPLGSLGRAAIFALADERMRGSPGALLLDRAGCHVLADVIAEETMIEASCDRTCVVEVCTSAMDALTGSIVAALGTLDLEWSTITLMGDLAAVDESSDLLPDVLIGPALTGRWGDPTGTMGEAITGSADALRADPLP
jgi:hypothetical protein